MAFTFTLKFQLASDDRDMNALVERLAEAGCDEAEHWHIAHVAARLGISRNTLYRKLRHHGISRPG
jgi:transcriptional regulator of acetoin/glycerol metabolism